MLLFLAHNVILKFPKYPLYISQKVYLLFSTHCPLFLHAWDQWLASNEVQVQVDDSKKYSVIMTLKLLTVNSTAVHVALHI